MSDSGKKVAVVLAANFEDVEATGPIDALAAAGAEITVIGTSTGPLKGKKGAVVEATATFGDVKPADFDLLVIPGGGSPENLRIDDAAVAWTKEFVGTDKPVGAICHGAQLLISTDSVKGKTLTAVNKIRDDIRNAGGDYVDSELVVDGSLITSRKPDDLAVFNKALVDALG